MAWLSALADRPRPQIRTLRRVRALAAALGDPQEAFRAVHVTGTNGKGSTALMCQSLLSATGLRTGAFTGPHLTELRERVTVDGEPVDAAQLAAAVARVAQAASRTGVSPTWFEAVTVSALLLLAQFEVDVAVIEVGMLGRFDATNIVRAECAVVTNVGRDHIEVVGAERLAIAAEKAGIVEPGCTLVIGERDPQISHVFEARRPARTLQLGRELGWVAGSDDQPVDLCDPWTTHRDVIVGPAGAHQFDNAALAVGAAQALLHRPLTDAELVTGLSRLRLPGRVELVGRRPAVVLDVAHNPEAANALRLAIDELVPGARPRVLVVGLVSGRSPHEFLVALGAAEADLVICTEPPSSRAMPAAELAGAADRCWQCRVRAAPDATAAMAVAVAEVGTSGVVVVTGSTFLVGAIRGCID